jgi:hypothetical protein
MLTTAVSIFAVIALLVPGFIIAELSVAGAVRPPRSDLELTMRALVYAVLIHLVFGVWTGHLAGRIGAPENWSEHVGALTLYSVVVLLAVPITVGVAINFYLRRAGQRDGSRGIFAAALDPTHAQDAFDYACERARPTGAFAIVELNGHSPETPKIVGGIYGRRSAVGDSPALHDLYLETLCTVGESDQGVRYLAARVEPERGIYIPANQVARIEFLAEGSDRLPA